MSAPSRNSRRRFRSPNLPASSDRWRPTLFSLRCPTFALRPCPSGAQACPARRRRAGAATDSTAARGLDRRARALDSRRPFSAILRLISPARITFAQRGDDHPACLRSSQVDHSARSASAVESALPRCRRGLSDTNPRFGKPRCSGIWPPSKPTLWKPPERDF